MEKAGCIMLMENAPTFSIFTPTYNRKHTLDRVFESLLAQSYIDFEWVIIDDGSTDGTELIVSEWEKSAPFSIQYYWQPNQGKHIAYNHFARVAKGELFTSIDSDDGAMSNALERFIEIWGGFTENDKEFISGVLCHSKDQTGKLVGKMFKKEEDADLLETLFRLKDHGEKWGFLQTRILREFPFPEDVKNVYVPEGYFMHQCAAKYKTRFRNDILRIYYINEQNDNLNDWLKEEKNRAGSWYGALAFLKFSTRLFIKFPKLFIANTSEFIKISLFLSKGCGIQRRAISNTAGTIIWFFCLPLGYCRFIYSKLIK